MTTSIKWEQMKWLWQWKVVINIRNGPHRTNSDILHGLKYLE